MCCSRCCVDVCFCVSRGFVCFLLFFFSSRRRHTRCALVTGVQTCALPIFGYAIERLVAGAPEWLPTACYVAAYFFGGFFTLREAIDNLRMKKFEIDTLMLVAAAGAAALGAWAEGALLL